MEDYVSASRASLLAEVAVISANPLLDKGVIPSASEHGSVCSTEFLKAIKTLLGTVVLYSDWKNDGLGIATSEEILAVIDTELKRLQKHPELYPSKSEKFTFLRAIHSLCDLMLENLISEDGRYWEDYDGILEEYNRKLILPSHDSQRTSWQQVLHNQAPGTGFNLGQPDGRSSTQIVPYGGIKLQRTLRHEIQCVKDEMQKLHDDIVASGALGMIAAADTKKERSSIFDGLRISSEGKLRRAVRNVQLPLLTVTGSERVRRSEEMTSLEELSMDYAMMEGQPQTLEYIDPGILIQDAPLPAAIVEQLKVARALLGI